MAGGHGRSSDVTELEAVEVVRGVVGAERHEALPHVRVVVHRHVSRGDVALVVLDLALQLGSDSLEVKCVPGTRVEDKDVRCEMSGG